MLRRPRRGALAHERAKTGPLTILGDLVHNATVSADLRARGIAIAHDVADVKTPTVMVTAHGASERALARTRALGFEVVEATCPLVHVAHKAVRALVRDGYHPVIVGQRGHVEVRGLTGDLDPLRRHAWTTRTCSRFNRIRESGGRADDAAGCESAAHCRSDQAPVPDSLVRLVDTICRPTKDRQIAAADLARQSDVVVVIGGANSNNTRELVQTCRRHCSHVYHVQTYADLRPGWFADVRTVGITAGTSTPDEIIEEVDRRIREFADAVSGSETRSMEADR